MALTLVSLNVERCRHEAYQVPWLKEAAPDILCLQEMLASRVPRYVQELGMRSYHFVPMSRRVSPAGVASDDPDGLCIMSKSSSAFSVRCLHGSLDDIPLHYPEDQTTNIYALLFAEGNHKGMPYRIVTTHLPKSRVGSETTEFQRHLRDKLLDATACYDDLILCGDFNAPRGYEIFESIAKRYRDNIPAQYTTSIDNDLHHAGNKNLQLVVDVLFTTPHYTADNVEYVCGLSDHCALRAQIAQAA